MNTSGTADSSDTIELGYCTNIHPAETWRDVDRVLSRDVPLVRARMRTPESFGIGLRLSARAARELLASGELTTLGSRLADAGVHVFTINGFPYGPFHGAPVKAAVYQPDWRTPERLAYTRDLITILAALMRTDADALGSISTVPLFFRHAAHTDADFAAAAANLLHVARDLVELERTQGLTIGLALEPEPDCALETTAEALAFFETHLLRRQAIATFARTIGTTAADAERALRRHLGLCLDACHAAVEYEPAAATIAHVQRTGVAILKLQVSAGLRVVPPSGAAIKRLGAFAESTYLHQTVVRRGERLTRYLDLPEALSAEERQAPADEWRVHFHVPVFHADLAPLGSTQAELRELLQLQRTQPFTRHLEVETYTWDVLPPELRANSLHDDIARELHWTRACLSPESP